MGKITAARRNRLPAQEFGLPGERAYPMPDRGHAINAKGRATQQLNAGHLTPGEHARIVSKANRVIKG